MHPLSHHKWWSWTSNSGNPICSTSRSELVTQQISRLGDGRAWRFKARFWYISLETVDSVISWTTLIDSLQTRATLYQALLAMQPFNWWSFYRSVFSNCAKWCHSEPILKGLIPDMFIELGSYNQCFKYFVYSYHRSCIKCCCYSGMTLKFYMLLEYTVDNG